MFNLIQSPCNRPDKLNADTSSEKYAIDFSRYCVSAGFDPVHQQWLAQYQTNLLFYYGNQWQYKEDLDLFLKDTNNNVRNRIQWVDNVIMPDVNQYIGNAHAMDLTIRASAISPRAKTRRESQLEENILLTNIANQAPEEVGNNIKKKFGLGETPEETETIFENLWQDNYVKTINMLCEFIGEKNKFQEKQGKLAFNLALSGLCTLFYEVYNGEMKWDIVPPREFYFDRTCTEVDLSDAEFQGRLKYLLPSEIYELFSDKYRKEIEQAIIAQRNNPNYSWIQNGRIPVYYNYWKESEKYKWGYVMDEYGYPSLERIDFVESGAKVPRFTAKDVIPLKDLNEQQKKILNGNNTATKYVDVIRYCIFIPQEIIGGKDNLDACLDYGIMPYQDTAYYKFASAEFPFKNYCHSFDSGFISTPISQLISPQRLINRTLSVTEHLVTTTTPSGVAYDPNFLDADGENQLLQDMYEGKPIKISSRGIGIPNVIGSYQGSQHDRQIQTNLMLNESYKGSMDRMTGINDSLRGESQGSEQLVGVTALQIQRGSLIQEPFYNAIVQVYIQAYQAIANVGKRIYAENEKELAIIVGDGNVDVIKVTKELAAEDFRIFIHREADIKAQKQAADAFIMQLASAQMIDLNAFADLYGRSTPNDVAEALRKITKEKNVMAMQQAKQQQEQAAAQAQMMQADKDEQLNQMITERNDKLAENQANRDNKKEIEDTKAVVKIATANKPKE